MIPPRASELNGKHDLEKNDSGVSIELDSDRYVSSPKISHSKDNSAYSDSSDV
jgi:hypothetical protein